MMFVIISIIGAICIALGVSNLVIPMKKDDFRKFFISMNTATFFFFIGLGLFLVGIFNLQP